jgi:hypothetical protein
VPPVPGVELLPAPPEPALPVPPLPAPPGPLLPPPVAPVAVGPVPEPPLQTPHVMSHSLLSRNHCEPHWPQVFQVAQSVPPGGWVSAQGMELVPPAPELPPLAVELDPPDGTVAPVPPLPPLAVGLPPPVEVGPPIPPLLEPPACPPGPPPESPPEPPPRSPEPRLEQAWARPMPSSSASEINLLAPRTLELVLILNSQMKWSCGVDVMNG